MSDSSPSEGTASPTEGTSGTGGRLNRELLEMIVVIVLSITTILTAWSAFQSSKWSGSMSISFSQASSARIESVKLQGTADQRAAIQVGLWVNWLEQQRSDRDVADFLVERFPEPLATAHADWLATEPLTTPDAPGSPFEMDSYVIPESVAADAADARADAKFAEALQSNQRGDNYTLLTVLFAAVLFFAAISNRFEKLVLQAIMLGSAIALGLVGVALLLSFPKLV